MRVTQNISNSTSARSVPFLALFRVLCIRPISHHHLIPLAFEPLQMVRAHTSLPPGLSFSFSNQKISWISSDKAQTDAIRRGNISEPPDLRTHCQSIRPRARLEQSPAAAAQANQLLSRGESTRVPVPKQCVCVCVCVCPRVCACVYACVSLSGPSSWPQSDLPPPRDQCSVLHIQINHSSSQ